MRLSHLSYSSLSHSPSRIALFCAMDSVRLQEAVAVTSERVTLVILSSASAAVVRRSSALFLTLQPQPHARARETL